MQKFVLKSVLFLAFLLIATFIQQKFIDNGLRKSNAFDFKEWNDIFQSKINADIIIQGSSRAAREISPKVLDSAFKKNSYNLGMPAFQFQMQYYRFLLYLKYNKKPKYIIQVIDHISFSKRADLFDYSQFLPYLDDSIIKEAVSSYIGLDWRDHYIPMYKYRENFNLARTGFINNFHVSISDSTKYKGFYPYKRLWNGKFKEYQRKNIHGFRSEVLMENVLLFRKFLDRCKKEKITVIFVNTPDYYQALQLRLNNDSIYSIYKKFSSEYNIPYFDYSKDSISLDTLNFVDYAHLNESGVRKFNKKLADDLKTIIVR